MELKEGNELIVNFADLCSGECLANSKSVMFLDDSQYVRNSKSKILAMKSKEQNRGVFPKGGRGRERKLGQDRWEAIKKRENNFVKTYNNQCFAEVVKIVTRNKAQTIRIIEPGGAYGEWAYYRLREQLTNKGKRYGTEIRS